MWKNDVFACLWFEKDLRKNQSHSIKSPNEIQVIDVRNEDEYKSGHVSGAVLLPVDQILDRIKEVPQNKSVFFICAAGVRSGLACEYAASMGYDPKLLFNIEEGTPSWIEANYPTTYE